MTVPLTAIVTMTFLIARCDKDNNVSVPATFTASIDDMQTRAAGTFWAKGDAIGISGKTGERTYTNICYLTSAGDGSFTVSPAADEGDNNIYFESDSPVDFTAYYPFTGTQGKPAATIEKEITAADNAPDPGAPATGTVPLILTADVAAPAPAATRDSPAA